MGFLAWLFPQLSRQPIVLGDDTKSTYDVFISHSSKDKQLAQAACAVLETHRIRCWIAPRDIAPGTEWGASIIDGIDSCRIMVLVFSAHADESPQVRREVERAISKGLALLPVRVQDVHPSKAMEFALSNTHWLNAFTPPFEAHLETLATSARVLLEMNGRKVGHATPSDQPVKSPTAERGISKERQASNLAERAELLIDLGYTLYALGLAQQTLGESDAERGRSELRDLFYRLQIALPQGEVAHEIFKSTRRSLLTEQERDCLDVGMKIGDIYGTGMVMISHRGTDYEVQARNALPNRINQLAVSLQSLDVLDHVERKQALCEILVPAATESEGSFSHRVDLLKASVRSELRRQLRDVSKTA